MLVNCAKRWRNKVAQNLPAPCYQVYAANVLASRPFRQAGLAVRGLVYTMEMECWVNHRLPDNPAELAKFLGIDAEEVAAALPAVMAFFTVDSEGIYSQRLEDYRAHLNEIREKQRNGGRLGAERANQKTRRPVESTGMGIKDGTGKPQVDLQVHPQVDPRVSNIVKANTAKSSQNQSTEKEVQMVAGLDKHRDWLSQYNAAERCTAEDYSKASGGE